MSGSYFSKRRVLQNKSIICRTGFFLAFQHERKWNYQNLKAIHECQRHTNLPFLLDFQECLFSLPPVFCRHFSWTELVCRTVWRETGIQTEPQMLLKLKERENNQTNGLFPAIWHFQQFHKTGFFAGLVSLTAFHAPNSAVSVSVRVLIIHIFIFKWKV